MITLEQIVVLKTISQILKDNNISFMITGGVAAILYGARRATDDIDLSVARHDIPRVEELFSQYVIKSFKKPLSSGSDIYLTSFSIDGTRVDVGQTENNCYLLKGGKQYCIDSDLDKALIIKFRGLELPVQDKEELISYKKYLNRPIDLQDILQIEQTNTSFK